MHLSYLKTVWSFWVLLLWFVRQVQRSAHSKANYFPLLSKIIPSFPTYATWIMRFSSLAGGIRHYRQPCGSVRLYSFQSYQMIFLLVFGSLLICTHETSSLCWTTEEGFLQISVVFFLCSSLLLGTLPSKFQPSWFLLSSLFKLESRWLNMGSSSMGHSLKTLLRP